MHVEGRWLGPKQVIVYRRYLIFCALVPIVATHQERSGTLTNLPNCGKVVSTKVGCGRFDGKPGRVAPALAVTGGFDDGADP